MSTLSTKEIEHAFEEYTDDWGDSSWSALVEYLDNWRGENDWKQVGGVGLVRLAASQTGGEGEGEYCYLIFELEDGRFFRKEGYYASFHGTDWDGYFCEVAPAERVITVYEPV